MKKCLSIFIVVFCIVAILHAHPIAWQLSRLFSAFLGRNICLLSQQARYSSSRTIIEIQDRYPQYFNLSDQKPSLSFSLSTEPKSSTNSYFVLKARNNVDSYVPARQEINKCSENTNSPEQALYAQLHNLLPIIFLTNNAHVSAHERMQARLQLIAQMNKCEFVLQQLIDQLKHYYFDEKGVVHANLSSCASKIIIDFVKMLSLNEQQKEYLFLHSGLLHAERFNRHYSFGKRFVLEIQDIIEGNARSEETYKNIQSINIEASAQKQKAMLFAAECRLLDTQADSRWLSHTLDKHSAFAANSYAFEQEKKLLTKRQEHVQKLTDYFEHNNSLSDRLTQEFLYLLLDVQNFINNPSDEHKKIVLCSLYHVCGRLNGFYQGPDLTLKVSDALLKHWCAEILKGRSLDLPVVDVEPVSFCLPGQNPIKLGLQAPCPNIALKSEQQQLFEQIAALTQWSCVHGKELFKLAQNGYQKEQEAIAQKIFSTCETIPENNELLSCGNGQIPFEPLPPNRDLPDLEEKDKPLQCGTGQINKNTDEKEPDACQWSNEQPDYDEIFIPEPIPGLDFQVVANEEIQPVLDEVLPTAEEIEQWKNKYDNIYILPAELGGVPYRIDFEHIFRPIIEVKPHGIEIDGLHHNPNGVLSKPTGSIRIEKIPQIPEVDGFYAGWICINGKKKFSTFFPDDWKPEQIIEWIIKTVSNPADINIQSNGKILLSKEIIVDVEMQAILEPQKNMITTAFPKIKLKK